MVLQVWVPSAFNVHSFHLAHVDIAKLFVLPQVAVYSLFGVGDSFAVKQPLGKAAECKRAFPIEYAKR